MSDSKKQSDENKNENATVDHVTYAKKLETATAKKDFRAIVRTMCLPTEDVQGIRKVYKGDWGCDFFKGTLGRFSSSYTIAIELVSRTRPEQLSTLCQLGIRGDHWQFAFLASCDDDELAAASKLFKAEEDDDMQDAIHASLKGNKDLQALMDRFLGCAVRNKGRQTPEDGQIDDDVKRLHKKGGFIADPSMFIAIGGTYSREYLAKVSTAYGKKHGVPLTKVIRDRFDGVFRTALLALFEDRVHWQAKELHTSMKGLGTRNKHLMALVLVGKEEELPKVGQVFFRSTNESVPKFVSGEFHITTDYSTLITTKVACVFSDTA